MMGRFVNRPYPVEIGVLTLEKDYVNLIMSST